MTRPFQGWRVLLPDGFGLSLVVAVVAASLLPVRGGWATAAGWVTTAAIVLLFFLHGAKLSRKAVVKGLSNWRLHLAVLGATFGLFPLLGLAVRQGLPGVIGADLAAGVLFLCLLPSTVQSSIAFTSLAGGDVPAAVASASASNILGVLVTPTLVALLMPEAAGHGGGVSLKAAGSIVGELLVPFAAGHLSRPLTAGWVSRHKGSLTLVDRGSILLVVYTAFAAAVVEGLWSRLSTRDLVLLLAVDAALLAVALTATLVLGRALGFSKAERITLLFCGSKKSLASGAPMAGVLFPAAQAGLIITPLMLFHQIQLMTCAVIARRYAAEAAAAPASLAANRSRQSDIELRIEAPCCVARPFKPDLRSASILGDYEKLTAARRRRREGV